jgi:hypothetical protein
MKTEEQTKKSIQKTLERFIECMMKDKIEFCFFLWLDEEEGRLHRCSFARDTIRLLGALDIEKQKLLWQVIDKDEEEDEKTNV